jgi:hypothetical protein
MALAAINWFEEETNQLPVITGNILFLEPGIYYDIPAATYHALPYVSSSFLKTFKDCPAAAKIKKNVTDDMNLGSGIHAYSLEGKDTFDAEFAIMFQSELNKNSKEYRERRAEFQDKNKGKIILPSHYLKTPTMEIIKGVDESLRTHPLASRILKKGFKETTLIWDDPETGLRCKARLDWHQDESTLVDLKKCADVAKFKSQICNFNYDIQAAHYINGALYNGMGPDTFIFIAVESEVPFAVKCGYLKQDWLEDAKEETKRLLGLVKECMASGNYPAYEIPKNIWSLSDLAPSDLLEEFAKPAWR